MLLPQHWQARRVGAMSRSGSAVLVSGGTSGLGRAMVEALAARGHQVFTCGRDAARLAEVGKVPGVSAFQVDVSDEASVVEFLDKVRVALKGQPLTAVINNAGLLRMGDPLTAMSGDQFDASYLVNTKGAFLITRYAWPLLKEASEPLVVVVGSTTEQQGFASAFHTTYAASKMALLAYSTGLRQELMVLHPGARVVHLKVGAHETGLEHDGDKAARNLAAYGPPYDSIAPKLAAKLNSDFKMVSYSPASDVADAVCKLVATPAVQMPRDVWINVSFLERLVYWLPAWVLDMSHVGKLQ